jgi:branched-chain amino acid aminotransferase
MAATVNVNGRISDEPHAVVSVFDHGFLYGEGVYEAVRRGATEALMRNYRGELAECSTSNIFIVTHGAALTPPIDAGLLPGITRELLFEIGAEAGIPVREQVLRDADLFGAYESFLTSTTREIVPIVRIDDRTIGSGRPGPVTKALLERFRRKTQELTLAKSQGSRLKAQAH